MREELDQLRARVRSLRETLTSASNAPSIEAISERLRLEERITNLKALATFFQTHPWDLRNLTDEWNAALDRRAAPPARGIVKQRRDEANRSTKQVPKPAQLLWIRQFR